MRMQTFGDFEIGDDLWILWIFDVNDRCPMRWIHMAHIRVAVFDDNRPAAGKIHAAELPDVFANSGRSGTVRCHVSSLHSLRLRKFRERSLRLFEMTVGDHFRYAGPDRAFFSIAKTCSVVRTRDMRGNTSSISMSWARWSCDVP